MLTHIHGIFKNGSDEPRERTGIKTQMKKMDFRTWEEGEGKLG